ncbi:hypothetical protein [Bradyrhizobium neotropicale]|uniref:hypothetical protein n=1 Tax=Bradyrhizobium neotropicale TaxID=1497615 RepID=UPI001AD7CAD1|nr:hypothetical protein [Bradyrhizobium neotropicale]MBO4222006.1 hypothetical protein [Bradyrhizobium neotropicale]
MTRSNTPYAHATSGVAAHDEITRLLRRFGCESIGFMDDYEAHEVLLVFKHRGRQMQLRASAKGWAALYLKEHPYSYRIKRTEKEHRAQALAQGQIAVNSILRDWIKGQLMAIETGILSFEAVFMPFMLTNDGRTLVERADQMGLLPGNAA